MGFPHTYIYIEYMTWKISVVSFCFMKNNIKFIRLFPTFNTAKPFPLGKKTYNRIINHYTIQA